METIEVNNGNTTTTKDDSSIVWETESSTHHVSALKDRLTRSTRSLDSSTSVSNIFPQEKINFHDSNDQTELTLELSENDDESSMEDLKDIVDPSTTLGSSLHRSKTFRLAMCGAIHESTDEGSLHTKDELNESGSDWSSVGSASVESAEDDEVAVKEVVHHQQRMVVHRRASNPLILGRRLSAAGSRWDSVVTASMQEAFQLVRETFEDQQQQTPAHQPFGAQQQDDEVSDLDDDDDDEAAFVGYYDHYEYGNVVPHDKKVVDMAPEPPNRKASIGQQLRQQDTTDYGYGDAVPDSRLAVDYGYGDATPDNSATATFQPSPPCVSWDVQEEDAAAKYGYGECHLASRRQSGAHYDYGYGSDHDMDSTWHHGENMGNQANRILPHQDPAVTRKPSSHRTHELRENSLRRSWNAQEQPRRRVQRRSSVTKFNLEESMAKVQQEEEEPHGEETDQDTETPRTYSTMGAVPGRKSKRGLRFFRSNQTRSASETKAPNSGNRILGLRDMFKPRHSGSSNITARSSGSTLFSPNLQPEGLPKRNSRFRLRFPRRRPKSHLASF